MCYPTDMLLLNKACAAHNVHWMIPRPVNSLFTGRSELVEHIQSTICNNDPGTTKQTRLVITGIGGIGKSEMCLQVADLLRNEYVVTSLCCISARLLTTNSFWGVFWVDVHNPSTAKSDFLAISKKIGSAAESVAESVQALANTKDRWLLILDNADNPEVDYAAYIPSGNQGVVIITSRVPECSQYSTLPAEALEGLNEEHSTQLLLKAARILKASWEPCKEQTLAIVQLLASHTLALIQAGAYIAEGHCRLEEYASKYKQLRERLLKHFPKQQQSRYQHVYATFEASVSVLNDAGEVGQDALDLLGVLSMLHSSMLPLHVFADAWDGAKVALSAKDNETSAIDTTAALGGWHVSHLPRFIDGQADEWDDYRLSKASALLVSLSLVTRHGSDKREGLSMHPLAHVWAKDRLQKRQQDEAWVRTGCLLALSWNQPEGWQMAEKHFQPDLKLHLQSFLSPRIQLFFSCGPRDMILRILLNSGWALYTMREDKSLESVLAGIYEVFQIVPQNPSEEQMGIWDLAARNLIHMGHAEQALELLEYVVKVRKNSLRETSPLLLHSQHTLATTYYINRQTKEAIALLEHVVKVRETTQAETHSDRLASQHELARAYQANRQTKEAIALLEHVVKVEQTTRPPTHPDRKVSERYLAYIHRRVERWST